MSSCTHTKDNGNGWINKCMLAPFYLYNLRKKPFLISIRRYDKRVAVLRNLNEVKTFVSPNNTRRVITIQNGRSYTPHLYLQME